MPQAQVVETNVPARLDRLPWSRWHLKIIIALGTSWLLDGLETTLAGSLAAILQDKRALGFSAAQVGETATFYLAGAVAGALLFGYLTDRFGRRKLFLITLCTYATATALTAVSWNFFSFTVFRLITGMGIGGEYAAINSAVDEFVPSKVRGTVDLIVNGTFWVGAALGAIATMFLLSGTLLSPTTGWRYAFGVGAILAAVVFFLRLQVPESPRWLMLRGKEDKAREIVDAIENDVKRTKHDLPQPEEQHLRLHVRHHTPLRDVFRSMWKDNRKRSLLGLSLMIGQSFFYNAVFFTYGLILDKFYQVKAKEVPVHLLPLALGNFFGPIVFGKLFDTIGRKPMITGTYCTTGVLLIAMAFPFGFGSLSSLTLGISLCVIFFVASSAASAAYLTVSEIFPLEIRAFAIAIFYAIGTAIGGVGAPTLFGKLIQSGSRRHVTWGYLLAAALMLMGGLSEWKAGVKAERQSLESISEPIQASS